MSAGAPLGYASWDGELPIHAAASRDQYKVVEVLLQSGVPVDAADKDGRTALMKAAVGGHQQSVDALIAGGAEVDELDKDGWTALMHAAAHNTKGASGVIASLVRAGADVDRQGPKKGKTALMIAAEKGMEEAVGALIRARARLDILSSGKTAMDYALAAGQKRCAAKLGYVDKTKS